jgi:hypothetical protein
LGDSRKHVRTATILEVFDEFGVDPDEVSESGGSEEIAMAGEAQSLGASFCELSTFLLYMCVNRWFSHYPAFVEDPFTTSKSRRAAHIY